MHPYQATPSLALSLALCMCVCVWVGVGGCVEHQQTVQQVTASFNHFTELNEQEDACRLHKWSTPNFLYGVHVFKCQWTKHRQVPNIIQILYINCGTFSETERQREKAGSGYRTLFCI